MKEKIVAFGEIMLRLTPPDYTTISQARNYVANYGGAEANVLVSLSHLGHDTMFLTKLPLEVFCLKTISILQCVK